MIPVDPTYWGLALLPLVLLLVTLVALRWKAHEAAAVGLFAAAAVAVAAFQLGPEGLSVASAKGVWDAVFVLYVVWPALLLYHVCDRAGAFEALRRGIQQYSTNDLFLVLAFGWAFASFVQAIAGFGTPIVVVAPLLLALGVKPLYSVVIPLIGHAWANTFGSFGVAWLALGQVSDAGGLAATALALAALLWIPNLLAGFSIAYIYGRMEAVKRAAPLVVVVSLIHGGGQLLVATWEPTLANFAATSVALFALYPIATYMGYGTDSGTISERPAMLSGDDLASSARADGGVATSPSRAKPDMSLGLAFLPYLALAAVALLVALSTPVADALGRFSVGLGFPAVETGYGIAVAAAEPYEAFAPLTHPGTFLLVGTAVAAFTYSRRGYFETTDETESLWTSLTRTAVPASIAIVMFLVMAKVMDHAGMTTVLAEGLAAVSTTGTFSFASPLIGVLGAFMTSSNTASNILFAGLQETTALALGVEGSLALAAQSTGGAIGNAVSPANVILGATAAGVVGREGDVLRAVIPWVALTAAVVGIAVVLMNALGLVGVA